MTASDEELDVGDAVADDHLPLVDTGGAPWRIGDRRGRPALLVFHRHVH